MVAIQSRLCDQCNKKYKPWHSEKVTKSSFCSRACRNKFHGSGRPRVKIKIKKCKSCQKRFEYWPSVRKKAKYCNKKCFYEGRKSEFRGYIDKEGYRWIHAPKDHPNAKGLYITEHRLVASQSIGRPIKQGEDVHHKNGNKLDNRPENLQVLSKAEHSRIHSFGHG